jgi:RimJ/RimL family protein N-acetyltransferase
MTVAEPIKSDRLLLTPLAVDDAAEMVSVLSDRALYEFTGGEPPGFEELQERYRGQSAGSSREDESWHNWIIRLHDTAIGFVQATVVGESADLAWVVGRPWQRRGFAAEASRAMRDWLRHRGIARFSAHIHPDHSASMAIAVKLGLAPTGEVDDDGETIWGSDG